MNTIRSIGPVTFVAVILATAGLHAGETTQRPPTASPESVAYGSAHRPTNPAGVRAQTPDAAQRPAFSKPQPTLLVAAPGEVEIEILIQPTEHSRELRIFADSGSYYRSTSIGLRGIDSEPLHSFIWRGFPVGDYEVVGVLLDDRGQEEVVVQAAMRVVVR